MSVEKLEAILAAEIKARSQQRYYLSGFLIAIAIVVTALVVL